jgi:hypothetical protein
MPSTVKLKCVASSDADWKQVSCQNPVLLEFEVILCSSDPLSPLRRPIDPTRRQLPIVIFASDGTLSWLPMAPVLQLSG